MLDTPRITIAANSQLSALSSSSQNPVINVNTNIPQNGGHGGNMILNAVLIQEGYINANNDSLTGFDISGTSYNTTINGGSYTAPDYKSPSTLSGAQAVSTATGTANTTLKNFTVTGNAKDGGTYTFPNACNIYITDGPPLVNVTCETWYVRGVHS
jgi:hypothetical protein